MPRQISFIVTNSGTINAVANGKSYTIARDHPSYKGIKEAIVKDDAAALERLTNVARAVQSFSGETVQVRDGVVYYMGEELHNTVTQRILGLMRDGFPFEPMTRFLANLMENPSKHSVDELYAFLEHKGLPITEDGCFLGYKAVRGDWTDKHSGKITSKPPMDGNPAVNPPPLKRNQVDDDWRNACSSGYHVGSLEYVKGFANDGDHILQVKVNPKDVVSVPSSENTKLRTCWYESVAEYDFAALKSSVYMPDTLHSATGQPMSAPSGNGGYGYRDEDDEDDEDYDDEYDDDLEEDDEDEDE